MEFNHSHLFSVVGLCLNIFYAEYFLVWEENKDYVIFLLEEEYVKEWPSLLRICITSLRILKLLACGSGFRKSRVFHSQMLHTRVIAKQYMPALMMVV